MMKLVVMISSIFLFNGCDYEKYIKIPCDYPTIEKVTRPTKKTIEGYSKCKSFVGGKWVFIGRCIDYKNTLILKAQNKKKDRVITAYENKIDDYTEKYLDKGLKYGI